MTSLKEWAKKIRDNDFIPKPGKPIRLDTLIFRRTTDDEVFQCGRKTGDDSQGLGSYYCGEIAEYVAFVNDREIVAMCGQHPPPRRLINKHDD